MQHAKQSGHAQGRGTLLRLDSIHAQQMNITLPQSYECLPTNRVQNVQMIRLQTAGVMY